MLFSVFGMHTIRLERSGSLKNIYVTVQGNLFNQGLRIDEKFDLKGSLYKRTTSKEKVLAGEPKKDLDFKNEKAAIKVSCEDYDTIVDILNEDIKFLMENNIIDYSLLIGIHDRLKSTFDENCMI